MMKIFLDNILQLMPQISILIGVLVIIFTGSFSRSSDRSILIFSILSVLISICYVFYGCGDHVCSFNGLINNSPLTRIFLIMVLSLLLIMLFFTTVIQRSNHPVSFEYYALFLLSGLGATVLIISTDLLLLYLGLELMSLPLYILTTYSINNKNSNEAGLKFFILGSVSSCLYLLGVSIIYGFTGSTQYDIISEYYRDLADIIIIDNAMPIVMVLALILLIVAFFFKISAVPFHMWTPDVYQGSPTIITFFLSTIPKVSSTLAIINILYILFGDLLDQWQPILIFSSVLSMAVSAFGAIMQKNIKRMLAYSTIGHIGFILMGICIGEVSGLVSSLIYMIVYIITNIIIFAILLFLETDSRYNNDIKNLSGLSKSSKWVSAAMMIAMLSMIGIPPTAGFFAKFYILFSLIVQEFYFLAIVGIISTVVSSFYYLRVIKVMYFDKNTHNLSFDTSSVLVIIIGLGLFANLGYFLFSEPLINLIINSVEFLMPN